MPLEIAETSSSSRDPFPLNEYLDQSTSPNEIPEEILIETSQTETTKKNRARKDFTVPTLVAALDGCQLSIRDSACIIVVVVEALDLSCDDFPIKKSSIQRLLTQIRKKRAESIKSDFQNDVPEIVTVHWDGKLLPGLDVRSSKEERLPIIISCGEIKQLFAVPKVESSTDKNQVNSLSSALFDWNLNDKIQIMCFDTTTLNVGRLIGACVLLEQKIEKIVVLSFYIYELVLK